MKPSSIVYWQGSKLIHHYHKKKYPYGNIINPTFNFNKNYAPLSENLLIARKSRSMPDFLNITAKPS